MEQRAAGEMADAGDRLTSAVIGWAALWHGSAPRVVGQLRDGYLGPHEQYIAHPERHRADRLRRSV